MTSERRRKKQARALGLTDAELALTQLLREVLDAFRWAQVLGYSNQFLLAQHLAVDPAERDRVLRAAAAQVELDGRIQTWQRRLLEIEAQLRAIDARLEHPEPGPPPPEPEAEHGA